MNTSYYKLREIKTYSSTEWLADNTKKYRSVFEQDELTFVYCEVSIFNKKYDEEDWTFKMHLKCFDEKNSEICNIPCDRFIPKEENVSYIREGWGVKMPGTYWKAGIYRWEAYVGEDKIASKSFYVENIGVVKPGRNPYFKLETVKLFEGSSDQFSANEKKF